MSNSKHLPSFTFDVLCCFNRDQLERFSIVCRPLKNLIERYFHSKPYRVFSNLRIHGGSYALFHKDERWHPSVQQFLAEQACSIDNNWYCYTYNSFAEMRPYLGPTIRIHWTTIDVPGDFTYNPEHIAEMEAIVYLWRNGNIYIKNPMQNYAQIVAEDFQLILTSPIILQCRKLSMDCPHFSLKDHKVLYTVNVIEIKYCDANADSWSQFLEQPGVKPSLSYIIFVAKILLTYSIIFARIIFYLDLQSEPTKIDGDKTLVFIDETVITKRKYNRGHLEAVDQWFLGGVEAETDSCWIVPIAHRSIECLDPPILKHCLPGSILVTDGLQAYKFITERHPHMLWTHETVNHSDKEHPFQNQETGLRTNRIEGVWQRFKRRHKEENRTHRSVLSSHTFQFLWMKKYKTDRFYHIVKGIKNHYSDW